jgi:hypothetical protein
MASFKRVKLGNKPDRGENFYKEFKRVLEMRAKRRLTDSDPK